MTYLGDGVFEYVPNEGYTGDDVFTYTVVDADGSTATASVSIDVNGEVIVNVPTAEDEGTFVNEAALDAGGSNAASDGETTAGMITYTAGDTPATVTIGGEQVTAETRSSMATLAR